MAKNKKKSKHGPPSFNNRRALYDYFIEDTLEVGIVLAGSEVKAIRDGSCSLKEGFITVSVDPPRLMLHQVDIGPYQPAGALNHRPKQDRMLLAKKREIIKLARQVDQKGVTLVPLELYFSQGLVKIKLAVARGKAQHDKRRSIAERESKRELQRVMSKLDR
ncbi:MAG: SsrA-binding protein SmpB [Phycisphaerales bacterium]|nr:SsrA-binding protein SmpB [Phycisphaerales bacterium]